MIVSYLCNERKRNNRVKKIILYYKVDYVLQINEYLMNYKAHLLFGLMITAAMSQQVWAADKVDYQSCYNYKRGMELLLDENNDSEALKFFKKELEEHKDNGYAYYWIGLINEKNDCPGQALEASNKAIKYLAKDARWLSYSYRLRARVNLMLEDDKKALADYTLAIKAGPDVLEAYQARGDYYYDKALYDLADADYRKMTELAPGDTYGYMALGRNASAQERYDDAIEQYNYAMKLAPSYSSAYSFRSEAEFKKKKYPESIDDAIKALELDKEDGKAFYMITTLADSSYNILNIKLKAQQKRNPNDTYWIFLSGVASEQTKRYKDAIDCYQKAYNQDESDVLAKRIAECYEELDNYPMAIMYINKAIELDSTYSGYQIYRVQLEEYSGNTDEALRYVEAYIENYPDHYYGYHKRGWLKDKNGGNIDEAIEDYTTSAALQPKYTYNYLCRGQLYRVKGDEKSARADFEEVLRLDTTTMSDNSARQYALFYLGDTIKAVEWMDKILNDEKCDDKKGAHYNAACLYSLMGDTDKSLEHLRKCLELGWCRFTHARRDDDLKTVRELPAFEALLKEYEQKHEQKLSAENMVFYDYDEKETEIPFAKEGGVCKVKCTINELPLYFIFDTGASDVSLSSVEAAFMLKNDYLSKSDMSGKGYYINANGDVSEGTIVNIKEVNFGGLTLKNVKASVVKNQKAPLLLGQSVLSRLGRIEIDNENKVIRVKYKEKK